MFRRSLPLANSLSFTAAQEIAKLARRPGPGSASAIQIYVPARLKSQGPLACPDADIILGDLLFQVPPVSN